MPTLGSLLKAKAVLDAMPGPTGFRWLYTASGMHRVCFPGHYRLVRRYRNAPAPSKCPRCHGPADNRGHYVCSKCQLEEDNLLALGL